MRKLRKRKADDNSDGSGEEDTEKMTVDEIKLIQKNRERKKGVAVTPSSLSNPSAPVPSATTATVVKASDGDQVLGGATMDGEEDFVLQGTFAQETAVHVEDPNMLKFVEMEMAKKKGLNSGQQGVQIDPVEDELYRIPDHLKVKRFLKEDPLSSWTTGIVEVQLPIEYKVRNIEATEAAKKELQERQPFMARGRLAQTPLPSSYSANYSQRGKEYAEKFRLEHSDGTKRTGGQVAASAAHGQGGGQQQQKQDSVDGRPMRQVATDEILLERFRKKERNRIRR